MFSKCHILRCIFKHVICYSVFLNTSFSFNNFSSFCLFSVVFFAVLISFVTFAAEKENSDNDSDNKY